jgi:pimeloyl-ACP methyl ester carboxylesterase
LSPIRPATTARTPCDRLATDGPTTFKEQDVPVTVSPRLAGDDEVIGQTRMVVVVLPGGQAVSRERFRATQTAHIRMLPVRWNLRRLLADRGVVVWQLKYRYRGWNEPDQDPVHDVSWALGQARRRYPGAAVVLVGHSMGGRAALRAAGDPSVIAICALAPWVEPDEPVFQLMGRAVLILHGDQDEVTDPRASYEMAARARELGVPARWVAIPGDGHAMLRKAGQWNSLTGDFVRSIVDAHGIRSITRP